MRCEGPYRLAKAVPALCIYAEPILVQVVHAITETKIKDGLNVLLIYARKPKADKGIVINIREFFTRFFKSDPECVSVANASVRKFGIVNDADKAEANDE